VEKLSSQLKLQWAMHPKEWMYTIAEAASQVSSPLYFGRSERLIYHSASEEPLRLIGSWILTRLMTLHQTINLVSVVATQLLNRFTEP